MVRSRAWPPAELQARSERKTSQIGSQEGTGTVCMGDQNREASHVDHEIKKAGGSGRHQEHRLRKMGLSGLPPGSNIPLPPSSKCGSWMSKISTAWEHSAPHPSPAASERWHPALPIISFPIWRAALHQARRQRGQPAAGCLGGPKLPRSAPAEVSPPSLRSSPSGLRHPKKVLSGGRGREGRPVKPFTDKRESPHRTGCGEGDPRPEGGTRAGTSDG